MRRIILILSFVILVVFFKVTNVSAETISQTQDNSFQEWGNKDMHIGNLAQSFRFLKGSLIKSINVKLSRGNSPTDNIFITVRRDNNNTPSSDIIGTSNLISSMNLPSAPQIAIFKFNFIDPIFVPATTRFWFVMERVDYSQYPQDFIYNRYNASSIDLYSEGELGILINGSTACSTCRNGTKWLFQGNDLWFEINIEYPNDIKNPIIILPGILGSWTNDFTRPFKNQIPIPQNELLLTEESKAKFWLGLANLGYLPQTWNDLKTKLPELGYPLYKCPYDWRLPNAEIASNYLIPCIDKAKQETGASKVDIVAHSMGGLVARSYIQNDLLYRNDIDKLVMLGTPNHGSVKAYNFWEGADATGGFLSAMGTVLESSVGNALIGMGVHNTRKSLIDYVHSFLPSVRELLPTFDYLTDQFGKKRSVADMLWQNDFLNNLNTQPSISRLTSDIKTKVFAGEGYDTLSDISVLYPNPDNTIGDKLQPYPDGQPMPLLKQNTNLGDGTVLSQASAQITEAGVQFHTKVKQPSDGKHFLEHANLPNSFVNEVIDFLGGTGTVDNIYLPNMPESMLSISLASPAELLVIDPQGRKVGFDATSGVEVNEVPNGVYSGKDELELVSIVNPEKGNYRVVIAGNGNGEFNTGISYANSSCDNNMIQNNYGHTQVGNFTNFTINFQGGCADSAINYALNAKVELEPEQININSRSGYIMAEIELPSPYKFEQIDISKLRLNDKILPVLPQVKHKGKAAEHKNGNFKINYEEDELEFKFKRSEVVGILRRGINEVIISGSLLDGTKFSGSDTLVVVGKKQ